MTENVHLSPVTSSMSFVLAETEAEPETLASAQPETVESNNPVMMRFIFCIV